MRGWQAPPERSGGGDGKGTWLKLAGDGDVAVVVFLGEPLAREVVFDGGKYIRFERSHQDQGVEAKVRFSINVGVLITSIAGIKVPDVKVLEMSAALYRDVFALRTKYGVTDWCFELKRQGKPKDPKTKYQVLPERQLAAAEKEWAARATLLDLAQLYDNQAREAPASAVNEAASRELAQLVGRLEREAQQRFLERFGIRTLGELTPSVMPSAIEYLRDQARARQPGAASPAVRGTSQPAQAVLSIGDEVAAGIIDDLKRLPRESVQEWLKHCGVQRVRELPVDRVPDAKAFLALLMKELGPATRTPVDPFA